MDVRVRGEEFSPGIKPCESNVASQGLNGSFKGYAPFLMVLPIHGYLAEQKVKLGGTPEDHIFSRMQSAKRGKLLQTSPMKR